MTSSDRAIPAGVAASDAHDDAEPRDTLPSPEPDAKTADAPALASTSEATDATEERDAPDTLRTPPPAPDA